MEYSISLNSENHAMENRQSTGEAQYFMSMNVHKYFHRKQRRASPDMNISKCISIPLIHPPELFYLIKRPFTKKTTMEVRELLQNIAYNCEKCAEIFVLPFCFRTKLPKDEIMFNREIVMNLMWLNGKPVLDVVDTENNLQNAYS